MFSAIAESNGWDDRTTALQLFTHLEGEYYDSPGRLAIFRRKFDNVSRRDGEDPASFATEVEILAVRGIGDVGQKAQTRMFRDRFILGQRDCGLRRNLDSVPPDTPIREIVDQCRVWESHSDMNRLSPAPALGPEVPVAVIQEATGDSSSSRREGDPGVSDRPTNCRDSREFRSKLMAGQMDVSSSRHSG